MKTLLTTLVLLMTLSCMVLSAAVPLDGEFVSDEVKSIAWMVKVKHPAVVGKGNVERYREAAYTGGPLIHRWLNNKLTVQVTKDYKESHTKDWVEVSPTTYRSVKAKDEHNTELVTTIEVIDEDNYYLEIRVNGRTTREYFTRKTVTK